MTRLRDVVTWPLPEVLLAYIELLKQEALETYQQKMDWYVQGRLQHQPTLPGILRHE